MMPLTETNMPALTKTYTGKVREVYDLGDFFMLVATDRISAFDVVFNEGIPGKGIVLTQVSNYWFETLFTPNHLVATNVDDFPEITHQYRDQLEGRAVLVKKAKRIDFECVVRGYLIGSGWKDYSRSGAVGGNTLPEGLALASKLPEPIFTPATKAPDGEHDINVTFNDVANAIGTARAEQLRKCSIEIYTTVRDRLAPNGIILADTKFEFGLNDNDELILIDECCTPDSSRFWDAATYTPGVNPDSYDKQVFRDYLESTAWGKTPPPPTIPAEVIEKTKARYEAIYTRITGRTNPYGK